MRLAPIAMAIALLAPLPSLAQGCGPTRLKVTESVVLDRTPEQLWALVGNFQAQGWDPDVAAVAGTGANQVDKAVRTIKLADGAVFVESLYRFDPTAMTYSYHIDKIDVDRLPVQNVSATLEVVPEAGGTKSKLVWRGAFYRYLKPGEPAPDVADAAAAKAVSTYFRSGLDGLKAKLDAKT